MNRSEVARRVAGATGLGRREANAAVKAVLDAIEEVLAEGGTVRLPGFGTFAVKHRPARTGRNPRTGATVAVPASRGVRFRAGKALRDAVNPGRG